MIPLDKEQMYRYADVYAPDDLSNEKYKRIADTYVAMRQRWKFVYDADVRTVPLRQLYITAYLFHDFAQTHPGKIIRYVSEDDSEYLYDVTRIMKCCGVEVITIRDENVLSTTKLIQTHGVEKIIADKYGQ